MKPDELLISTEQLPWQKPISIADQGSTSDSVISRQCRISNFRPEN